MFELESATGRLAGSTINFEFGKDGYYEKLTAVSALHWEEHCTECAAPDCYRSCALYQPRKDGKCRRFIDGIVPIQASDCLTSPAVMVKFKRWGSLMAKGHCRLVPVADAKILAARVARYAYIAGMIPDGNISIAGRKAPFTRLLRRKKVGLINEATKYCNNDVPTHFVCEAFNPGPTPVSFTLAIRVASGEKNRIPFQHQVMLPPGPTRVRIPYSEIEPHMDRSIAAFHTITPNNQDGKDGDVSIIFGLIGYVVEIGTDALSPAMEAQPLGSLKTLKVVVWDLDNTIWNGTLIEDGVAGVSLNGKIARFIFELDQRGIVNSISSKNDEDIAKRTLQHFGLDEYFVFPRISWSPKSQSVDAIIKDFDVGADTVAFIDDQPFERSEVATALPKVRVYDPADIENFRCAPEFNPPVSKESASRRIFYQRQMERKTAQQGFTGEYFDFLKSCQIELQIEPAQASELERLHELVQRTNQLNFSGTRYSKSELAAVLDNPSLDKFRLSCVDRFGSYGTVGFVIVNRETATVSDMMLSCRVQSKMVEHSFFRWLAHFYRDHSIQTLTVRYSKTERNGPVARVMSEIGFASDGTGSKVIVYTLDMATLRAFESPLIVKSGGA